MKISDSRKKLIIENKEEFTLLFGEEEYRDLLEKEAKTDRRDVLNFLREKILFPKTETRE